MLSRGIHPKSSVGDAGSQSDRYHPRSVQPRYANDAEGCGPSHGSGIAGRDVGELTLEYRARVAVSVAVNQSETRNSNHEWMTVSFGKSVEGPVGFEPTTPGLKVLPVAN